MSLEDQKKIDALISHIRALPSLPSLVIEILQSINNDNIDTSTLAKKIASDLGIVAKVMRVANSPFFGLSGQISSISEAIVVIGINNLRGLVTSAAIINMFPKELKNFDLQGFWQHSIRTAVCAKLLAKSARVDVETAFTAGLLHDIGILVMGMYFPQIMQQKQLAFDASSTESLQFERDAMGMDHAALGGEVAKYWHFPEVIREAIALHHAPTIAEPRNILVDVMYVANLFAHALTEKSMLAHEHLELAISAKERLGIEEPVLETLAIEAQQLYVGASMLIAA